VNVRRGPFGLPKNINPSIKIPISSSRSRTISEGPDGKLVVDDDDNPPMEMNEGGPLMNGYTNGHNMDVESSSQSDD